MKKPGRGFVRRLAMVVFVALVAIGPLVLIVQERATIQETRQTTYELCMDVANTGSTTYTREYCWDQRFPEGGDYAPFWPQYGEHALAFGIVLAVLYLLAWLLAKLAAWTWRGSKAQLDQ